MLNKVTEPDPWLGLQYIVNLYQGCQHQCVYCHSHTARSTSQTVVEGKVNPDTLELFDRQLANKGKIGTIGSSSPGDPYMPLEDSLLITRQTLQIIAARGFPAHILTKSDLVLRDFDLLEKISQVYAAVTFGITTPDDDLGKKLEPGASLVSERLRAMETLANRGILTGVLMRPVLPFLEDDPEDVRSLIEKAAGAGARYILPVFGVTVLDDQRNSFYRELDRLFPGIGRKYRDRYGDQPWCPSPNAGELQILFDQTCAKLGITTRMPLYRPGGKL
jgi:DNA repair photolyase